MPKYDGMVRVKFQATKEILVAGASGTAEFTVRWGDNVSGAMAGNIVLADCPEFPRYQALYN